MINARVLLMTSLFLFFSFSGISSAVAKKFDFKSASVATYLNGTFGQSSLGQSAFGDSSGTATTSYTENVKTGYSGGFGILFSTSIVNVKLGAEMVLPGSASETKGKDDSGTQLFNVASSVSALVPTAAIEYVFTQDATSKFFLGASVGYATVKLENDYVFTAAGTSRYNLADFKSGASGTTTSLGAYAGYELLFADNCTVTFDLGYRSLKIDELKYDAAETGFQGAKVAGEPVVNNDGMRRSLDMSGAYVGLGLRFYIGL